VLIRDAEVLDKRGRVRGKVLTDMFDKAVASLTGKSSADEAWKTLLKPTDVLGLKTNVWKYLATPPALEKAIFNHARTVGIAADRIHTDDRGCRTSLAKCTALVNARPLRSHHWSEPRSALESTHHPRQDPPQRARDAHAALPRPRPTPLLQQVSVALPRSDRLHRSGRR